MKCQDFREIIDSYLCDELLTETNHDILRHLEDCANCRNVIEVRRILRSRIKSAVLNAPEFQMRADFYDDLSFRLKNAAILEEKPEKVSWLNNINRLVFAACSIVIALLGFWFLQTPPILPPLIATTSNQTQPKIALADFAVGDHQNCAVKYNLSETPVEIDLLSAQYADLRQGVLEPLQNSGQKYEFVDSHICQYAGHKFTHIVFRQQQKTISVLLTDLNNYPALEVDKLDLNVSENLHIARFDVKGKAVFVVSDLSETENTATAKILENPSNRKFLVSRNNQPNLFEQTGYQTSQAVLIGH